MINWKRVLLLAAGLGAFGAYGAAVPIAINLAEMVEARARAGRLEQQEKIAWTSPGRVGVHVLKGHHAGASMSMATEHTAEGVHLHRQVAALEQELAAYRKAEALDRQWRRHLLDAGQTVACEPRPLPPLDAVHRLGDRVR